MIIKPVVIDAGDKIRLVCVNSKEFKTSLVSVTMLVPMTQNLAENMVLSTYLTHSSLKYPTLASLNSRLENLYGATISGYTIRKGESCKIQLSVTCIDNKFALENENISGECLELLMDLLMHPNAENNALNADLLELEKRLCVEEIESELNDKRSYAYTRMIETMCSEEIYGITKAEILEDVKAITPQSAYKAWVELLEKSTVQISLVGNVDNAYCEDLVKKSFSDVKRSPVENTTVFVEQADDVTEETEDMDINQSKLVIGFRSGMKDSHDNFYAEKVMVDVFGGGPYSRLFMNVREKLSLCYYCSARLVRDKGLIVIQSGIEKDNKQKVLDEINKQLEIMKKGEFAEADFNASKAAIIDAMRGICDTPDGIDSFIGLMINDDIITPQEMIEQYEKVTVKDVIDAANKVSLDTIYMLSGKEGE